MVAVYLPDKIERYIIITVQRSVKKRKTSLIEDV